MITVAFFRSKNIISRLIRFILNSPISHCAVGLELDGVKMFLHSARGGVQLTPRSKMLRDEDLIYEYKVLPDLSQEIPEAIERVGEKYDVLGLFGFIFVLMGRLFKLRIKNILAQRNATVCSEFVMTCDIHNEIPEFANHIPDETNPKELLTICQNGKSFEEIK